MGRYSAGATREAMHRAGKPCVDGWRPYKKKFFLVSLPSRPALGDLAVWPSCMYHPSQQLFLALGYIAQTYSGFLPSHMTSVASRLESVNSRAID